MSPDRLGLRDNFSPPVDRLMRLPKFGAGIGLARMKDFCDALPFRNWFANVNAIRVTGSKGKGSVSAMIAAILAELGFRTGLYTSPHLVRFHERIGMNGECVASTALAAAAEWVFAESARMAARNPGDHVGAFEAFTAAALHCFGAWEAEAVVAEAGLGGRFDSTRVIPGRVVCLTSVELEHTELLGTTAEMIAYDKSDLCPDGGVLVAGELEPGVRRRLGAYCAVRGVEVVDALKELSIANGTIDDRWMRFDLTCRQRDFGTIETPLLGEHQARNAGVAVVAVERWLAENGHGLPEARIREAIRVGLRNARWPGRLQRVSDSPEITIDVGHTPQSVRAVAQTLRRMYGEGPILLVTGVSEDKNVDGVLAELAPVAAEIVCTRAYHKGAPVECIVDSCRRFAPSAACSAARTIEVAMDAARERALAQGMPIVVAGGLFLAVEAWVHLQGENPRALRFF